VGLLALSGELRRAAGLVAVPEQGHAGYGSAFIFGAAASPAIPLGATLRTRTITAYVSKLLRNLSVAHRDFLGSAGSQPLRLIYSIYPSSATGEMFECRAGDTSARGPADELGTGKFDVVRVSNQSGLCAGLRANSFDSGELPESYHSNQTRAIFGD